MSTFIKDLLELPFLQNAILAGILCSISSGIVGTYVVLRRITYIAAAISHCVLGGLGAAKYLSAVYGWTWLKPVYGAVITALIAALIIGWISLRAKEREDSVISALWAVGMSAGVLFIYKTPGFYAESVRVLPFEAGPVTKKSPFLIEARFSRLIGKFKLLILGTLFGTNLNVPA